MSLGIAFHRLSVIEPVLFMFTQQTDVRRQKAIRNKNAQSTLTEFFVFTTMYEIRNEKTQIERMPGEKVQSHSPACGEHDRPGSKFTNGSEIRKH